MLSSGWRELLIYVIAGAVYIAAGVFYPQVVFSWVEGAGYLLVAVWLVPALIARIASRR